MKKFPSSNFQFPINFNIRNSQLENKWKMATGNWKFQNGFMAFTSLLIISAVTLAITISISLLGVNESRNSLDNKRSVETFDIAKSCAEEVLLRLKNNSSYAGGSLIVGDGECSISISGAGEDRTINIEAQIISIATYKKRLQLVVKMRGGGIVLRQYKQLP